MLGRSSSSSKENPGLFIVSIVAVVAVVALFLMTKGGSSKTLSTEVLHHQNSVTQDYAGGLHGTNFVLVCE